MTDEKAQQVKTSEFTLSPAQDKLSSTKNNKAFKFVIISAIVFLIAITLAPLLALGYFNNRLSKDKEIIKQKVEFTNQEQSLCQTDKDCLENEQCFAAGPDVQGVTLEKRCWPKDAVLPL